MNRRRVLLTGAAGLAAMAAGCATAAAPVAPPPSPAVPKKDRPVPPVAKKEPKTITQLGRTRVDDYAWMKDDNWQTVLRDPSVLRADVRAHLEAENAYTKAMLASAATLQDKLFEEMKGRIKEDDSAVPTPDGPWEYYTRFQTGAQYPLYVRRPRGKTDGEQVLVDAEAQGKGKAFYDVGQAEHAPDHALYAYAVDDQGSEVWTVYVRDLATGKDLPDPIRNCYGGFAWSPDSKWIFWTFRDDNGRPSKIYRRPARGGAKDDVLVHEEKDEGFFLGVGVSASNRWIVIETGNQEQSEAWVIPAATPTAKPKLFTAREPNLRYDLEHWDGRWIIRTNADGAVDFKLMTASETATDRKAWKDFLPHRPGTLVSGVGAVKDYLVRLERENALPRVVVRNKKGEEYTIAFDEEAYALGLEGGYEWDTTTIRYVYNSMTTPRQWFDYDLATKTRTLRKTQEIPSGHDPARYVTKRLYAKGHDGVEIPVTVLMRKDTPLDGSAPVLLYGYGSYGYPMEASFSIQRLSLVERGWIWALAHVRGGSDKGWGWFLDGRKEKKVNTFKDFISVADDLVARKYARPRNIVAYGGSAGGLLMGAIANMRPELWGGVIGAVPFVDVINTMSDASLPLTPPEWPEWGNPLEDAAAYDTIAAYSPYDNVADKPYPPILATGGLSDPRVTYWEPAKWIARLRDKAPNAGPYLLKINMEAGHGGSAGRFDYLKEIAFDFAFAVKAVGSPEAGGGF
ncbi:MAG: S9 family peptidase [Alphaproteobacteria bacterium]|nr:S9 family peptidase [Alphaproteobacteria bacterium]